MELRALKVNEMYDLLDAYEVKIPAADQVKKDDLKEAREALTAKTGEAEGSTEGKMGQMTATSTSRLKLSTKPRHITASLATGTTSTRRATRSLCSNACKACRSR